MNGIGSRRSPRICAALLCVALSATPLAAQTLGEAMLASAWRGAPADTASLSDLYRRSREVRDQRVLDAVMAVAQDPAAGWWRRATAMRVMAAYVRPSLSFCPDHIRIRGDSASRLVHAGHWVQREGSVPLGESWAVGVRMVLQRLAAADADSEVRHTAGFIAESLRPAWPPTGRSETTDSTFRAECRRAARTVLAGRAELQWRWAADRIGNCDDSAGEAIAAWLRRAATDSLEILQVYWAARGIRDQRILDAAIEVARDSTREWRQRVSAMHLLGAYVDPKIVFEPDDLTSRRDGTAIARGLGHAIHQIDGTRPLPTGFVLTIQSILESVATESADVRVSSAARLFASVARNRVIR